MSGGVKFPVFARAFGIQKRGKNLQSTRKTISGFRKAGLMKSYELGIKRSKKLNHRWDTADTSGILHAFKIANFKKANRRKNRTKSSGVMDFSI